MPPATVKTTTTQNPVDNTQAAAPSQPVVQQPVSPEVRAFVGRYCARIAEIPKKVYQTSKGDETVIHCLDSLHNEIIRILVKPENQCFFLQQLASSQYVDWWPKLIGYLPDALKVKIFEKLGENDHEPSKTVYFKDDSGKLLIRTEYAKANKLEPVFAALAQEQSITPLTNVEQFLQEMVFQLFVPIPPSEEILNISSIFKLTEKHKEQFATFSPQQQATVIHSLRKIQSEDIMTPTVLHAYDGGLLFPVMNALFDLSTFQSQDKRGTTPLAYLETGSLCFEHLKEQANSGE